MGVAHGATSVLAGNSPFPSVAGAGQRPSGLAQPLGGIDFDWCATSHSIDRGDVFPVCCALVMMVSGAPRANAPGRVIYVVGALFTFSRARPSAVPDDKGSVPWQSVLLSRCTASSTGETNARRSRVFTILVVYTKGFAALTTAAHSENRVGSYYDWSSECHFVVARPSVQPDLWAAYLGGARTSYRRFGVERVLEYEQTRDGKSTTLFFAALDQDGQVAGGMRAQGPYLHTDQAHAVTEWAGQVGAATLRAEISDRIPSGVIEMKTGWVSRDAPRRPELTAALARVFVHSMMLLNARYALGTVAAHAVRCWQSTGGVVSTGVTPVAYPDDRYLTAPMWWDREAYADLVAADQLPRLIDESAQLCEIGSPGLAAPTA